MDQLQQEVPPCWAHQSLHFDYFLITHNCPQANLPCSSKGRGSCDSLGVTPGHPAWALSLHQRLQSEHRGSPLPIPGTQMGFSLGITREHGIQNGENGHHNSKRATQTQSPPKAICRQPGFASCPAQAQSCEGVGGLQCFPAATSPPAVVWAAACPLGQMK